MPKALKVKKLVSVLAAFISMTDAKKKAQILEHIPYIYYPIQFKKNVDKVQAFIDSKSEVNIIAPVYEKKLDLRVQKTDVKAQKIEGPILKTYDIVLADF